MRASIRSLVVLLGAAACAAGCVSDEKLVKYAMDLARETPGVLDCHSVEAYRVGGNVVVRMHCTVDSNLSVARVHDITEELGFKFRKAFPQISKISIHPEPKGRA